MFILPYSVDLNIKRIPYVTCGVIILCLLIYYFQAQNNAAIKVQAEQFCSSNNSTHAVNDPLSIFYGDSEECIDYLEYLHSRADDNLRLELVSYFEYDESLSEEEYEARVDAVLQTYRVFALDTPPSFDAILMYYPSSLNPLTIILSGVSHGSWMHVIGNLIFFFAFAVALELIVGSALKFIGVILLIKLVTSLVYSLVSLADPYPIPSLGLSGVVMGMIGFSAFIMPWARIKTYIFSFSYIPKLVSIPAWILAVWFIGFDTWNLFTNLDNGGVNLVAHVSGGFAGYLIARYWFAERRADIQEELDDEIEYARRLRNDKLGILNPHKDSKNATANIREKLGKQEFSNYIDSVYRKINLAQDSEAILAMLEKYDQYHKSAEIYEELFQEVKHADKSRAILCVGRLAISLLIEQKKYGRALKIAEQCLDISKIFVLADPNTELMLLKKKAMESYQYKLAYRLICNSEQRYGYTVDTIQYQLMEAQILWYHLADTENAREIVKKLQQREMGSKKTDILSLAVQIGK